ncbi:hypothetical protein [Streptococcus anginosus]|uniref:hypothetical protein n=1 Tax=Streptococcus anginosus TaxID=1328 RepID=UPI0022E83B4E|nr:hypothetical protein [Streptococcus anginosus]
MLEKSKEHWVWVILVLLLLFFAGLRIVQVSRSSREEQKTTQSSSSSKTKNSSTLEEETPDQRNYRKAKLKLEHPYTEASQEAKQLVIESVNTAVDAIIKAKSLSEVKATYENHLAMSQGGMIQTFAMAILVNRYQYQSSQIEVMKSDNDDVVQVIIPLVKEGEEKCYFIANFNTTVKQIQLTSYIGGRIGGTYG